MEERMKLLEQTIGALSDLVNTQEGMIELLYQRIDLLNKKIDNRMSIDNLIKAINDN